MSLTYFSSYVFLSSVGQLIVVASSLIGLYRQTPYVAANHDAAVPCAVFEFSIGDRRVAVYRILCSFPCLGLF